MIIERLKKLNPYLLLFLTGVTFWFSMMYYTFSIVGTAAAMTGSGYVTMLVTVSLMSVLFSALIANLLVRVTFRIVGGLFSRFSGLLYPFPIRFGEFSRTLLSFSFLCFFVCGLVSLPVLFLPTLSLVLGAVRTLTTWIFLFLGARYFVKTYSHDYDRKALVTALSVIPLVLVGLSLILAIVEVAL